MVVQYVDKIYCKYMYGIWVTQMLFFTLENFLYVMYNIHLSVFYVAVHSYRS